MSKIKTLKKQNPDLNFHVVDFLNAFDPSPTGKYTEFLLSRLKERLEWEKNSAKCCAEGNPSLTELKMREVKRSLDELSQDLFHVIIRNFNEEDLEELLKFHNHETDNRIDNSDISTYKNWDEIRESVGKAEIKLINTNMDDQIDIIHRDDTWFVLRPLTRRASLVYGAGTRWCTSMRDNPHYFYTHSQDILMYVINLKTGKKWGIHVRRFNPDQSKDKNVKIIDANRTHRVETWDENSDRRDMLEIGLSPEVYNKIVGLVFDPETPNNCDLFDESEKHLMDEEVNCDEGIEVVEEYYPDDEINERAPTLGEAIEEGIEVEEMEFYFKDENGNEVPATLTRTVNGEDMVLNIESDNYTPTITRIGYHSTPTIQDCTSGSYTITEDGEFPVIPPNNRA